MNASTERLMLQGSAGPIEVLRDAAATDVPARGVALIAHPHPLFGGTMDNKVVQTLARAFVQCGWTAVRFNFRGVGKSGGVHDAGQGEAEDFVSLLAQVGGDAAAPVALAGFSFGAFVVSRALLALPPERPVETLVLIGTAASRFDVAPLPASLHERSLVVHGESDDTVPLASVMDWARPQSLPVTVVPGGGHFFHGQLPLLKSLVVRHLRTSFAV
jgi:alpha/beta superfamily hydrolase